MAKTPLHRTLYVQVLIAIAIAVALGCMVPEFAVRMKPFGDGFVQVVRALVTPLVFCTVALGIAGASSAKSVGKVGGLAFIYFEVLTTFALIVGLLVVNFVAPGVGMNVDVTKLDASAVATYAERAKTTGMTGFLLDLIPTTLLSPLTAGHVLQTLVVALLFGFAMQQIGQRARPVRELIEACSAVTFRIVELVMRAAPIGAFGAMAFTIGSQGVASLIPLGKMMLTFYASCALFVFGVLGLVARAHGFSLLQLLRYVREEILLVLGTSSSEAALPRLLGKLENLGVRKDVVHLVLPAGYSFNLDGTCLYLTIAAVFLAQATNTPLALGDQIMLLLVLLVSSKGAAGVAGSGFIVLASTLSVVGTIPVAAMGIILGVDRFLSEGRALCNLIGNCVITLSVAVKEGGLRRETLRRNLESALTSLPAGPSAGALVVDEVEALE